jgi:hypothetical protein
MATNNGEHVLDALLSLGYDVEITEEGKITATNGAQTLHGKAALGGIEWADRSLTFRVVELAYIAKLRKRVSEARS